MAKYLSNKFKSLKIGLDEFSENKTSLTIIGNVGIGETLSLNSVTGIITAVSFKRHGGASSEFLMADGSTNNSTFLTAESDTLDSILTRGNTTTKNLTVGDITADNISVGGTITYDDVTSVDSLGIVTARSGIYVGPINAGVATITADGNATFSGIITSAKLNVSGITNFDNKVGIGTTDPDSKLHVSSTDRNVVVIERLTNSDADPYGSRIAFIDNVTSLGFPAYIQGYNGGLELGAAGTPLIGLSNAMDGRIGIGRSIDEGLDVMAPYLLQIYGATNVEGKLNVTGLCTFNSGVNVTAGLSTFNSDVDVTGATNRKITVGLGNTVTQFNPFGFRVFHPSSSGIFYQNDSDPLVSLDSGNVKIDTSHPSKAFSVEYSGSQSFFNTQDRTLFNFFANTATGQFTVNSVAAGGGEELKIVRNLTTIRKDLVLGGGLSATGISTFSSSTGSIVISDDGPSLTFISTSGIQTSNRYRIKVGGGRLNLQVSANNGASYVAAASMGGIGNIFIPDNDKVYFGTNNDAYIQHDNSNLNIINTTGNIDINGNVNVGTGTEQYLVGIGTNNPQVKLHVSGDGAKTSHIPTFNASTRFVVSDTINPSSYNAISILGGVNGAAFVKFGDKNDENAGQIGYYNSDDSMRFYTNGSATEKLHITSDGKVGIGTADPQGTLQVGTGVTVYGNAGIVSATKFIGDGSGLTDLPADQLTGNLPAVSGANLTDVITTSGGNVGDLSVSGIASVGIGTTGDTFTGKVDLFHEGEVKLRTTPAGVQVVGILSATSLDFTGAEGAFSDDLLLQGGSANALWDRSESYLQFNDGAKAVFGTDVSSGDLEIYHSGSHSYINEDGAGQLLITTGIGTTAAMVSDGSITLYYQGTERLKTTSTGITLSGTLSADIDGNAATATKATDLAINATQQLLIQTGNDATDVFDSGTAGYVLQSNGSGLAPSWSATAPANAITGITIREDGLVVGSANSVSTINFTGAGVGVTFINPVAGIATVTIAGGGGGDSSAVMLSMIFG